LRSFRGTDRLGSSPRRRAVLTDRGPALRRTLGGHHRVIRLSSIDTCLLLIHKRELQTSLGHCGASRTTLSDAPSASYATTTTKTSSMANLASKRRQGHCDAAPHRPHVHQATRARCFETFAPVYGSLSQPPAPSSRSRCQKARRGRTSCFFITTPRPIDWRKKLYTQGSGSPAELRGALRPPKALYSRVGLRLQGVGALLHGGGAAGSTQQLAITTQGETRRETPAWALSSALGPAPPRDETSARASPG
jgi:hypothetical protein